VPYKAFAATCIMLLQGLNSTWFVPEPARKTLEGSKMHAIYAVSWEKTKGTVEYPLTWTQNKTVHAYDVSEYYNKASQQLNLDLDLPVAWAL